jgi:hypothetical protein
MLSLIKSQRKQRNIDNNSSSESNDPDNTIKPGGTICIKELTDGIYLVFGGNITVILLWPHRQIRKYPSTLAR